MSLNERITENIVRKHFQKDGMCNELVIEEQKSQNPRIQKALQNASKKGAGTGRPEFLISHKEKSDLVIVVECKADVHKHESENRDKHSEYAVDGVLLYAAYLAKDFDNVLAIAVSGQSQDELKISHFHQKKGRNAELIFGSELLPVEDYIGGLYQDREKMQEKYEELLDFSKELNEKLHNYKIKEDKRSLLLSGILLALKADGFRAAYQKYKSDRLAEYLVQTINAQWKEEWKEDGAIPPSGAIDGYNFIENHPRLSDENNTDLRDLIKEIDERINSFDRTYKYYDIIGQFYIEFLKYSNAEKGLGIVLTPPHITEFFCDIAEIQPTDTVYDSCAGTAGFLVSAMKVMIQKCEGNRSKERKVKTEKLIGVEYQREIYPLAVSNMFLHGDGKSNIRAADCLADDTIREIKAHKPSVGLLNPPYKSKKGDTQEMEFVLKNLECLQRRGRCVAIVPMSCVSAKDKEILKLKERIMHDHTVKAVFSMPDELFKNSDVGVGTVIIVIEAHRPHTDGDYIFLGYFKDDGFTNRKTKGRFDYDNRWSEIKDIWLDAYRGNKAIKGLSVMTKLTHKDEWCAEAHMETNYDEIRPQDFVNAYKKYVAFKFLQG